MEVPLSIRRFSFLFSLILQIDARNPTFAQDIGVVFPPGYLQVLLSFLTSSCSAPTGYESGDFFLFFLSFWGRFFFFRCHYSLCVEFLNRLCSHVKGLFPFVLCPGNGFLVKTRRRPAPPPRKPWEGFELRTRLNQEVVSPPLFSYRAFLFFLGRVNLCADCCSLLAAVALPPSQVVVSFPRSRLLTRTAWRLVFFSPFSFLEGRSALFGQCPELTSSP